jgi:dolichol-phosphate mannosyltransferase
MHSLLCSVIIPTYNEAGNIVQLLDLIYSTFATVPHIDCEIFVVDDHSTDSTASLVERYRNPSTHLLQRATKLGIGSAYRFAFPHTKGDMIAIMDADFSHNPTDLRALLEAHTRSAGCVVFSSRYTPRGRIENWGFFRRLLSFFANRFSRFILRIPFTDVTSAFRVYSRDVFAKISERSVARGFAFQVESAFLSKSLCQHTVEVPVIFRDRTHGRSKFDVWEILAFLLILLRCFVLAIVGVC